ncbi:MAG TPA: DUF3943 domain-containing protein, partial [Polyangiaceae bacterium]|nr:DUF3943 domain-containing protein [Polyangiaceae bacterium]
PAPSWYPIPALPPALRLELGPPRYPPHYARTALETIGLLALGTIQYWMAAAENKRDWDFPRWDQRLSGTNIRFDNNTHATNNLLHPLAGGAYYGFARSNGLSVGEAALTAQIAAAIWEFGLEWREKASINDLITTTAAGTAVGEFWVQLASYLNSAPSQGGWARELAAATLGFPVWFHDRLDGREPDPRAPPDNLGLSAAYRHRFTLDLQNSWLDDTYEQHQQLVSVRTSAELSSLSGFLEARSLSTLFAEGNFSEASLDLGFGASGLESVDIGFDAVLAGYYRQWAEPGLSGFLAGLGTGLRFVNRDTIQPGDQYALAHFAGPSLAFFWKAACCVVSLASRLYGDFAAIHSLAWPAVHRADPGDVFKSTLERGYQYNLGASSHSYAALRLYALVFEAQYELGAYRSIEGLDREQEQITNDLPGTEKLDERRFFAALEPPGTPLRFYAGLERLLHDSKLGTDKASRLERRFVAGAGVVF